jgi:hypothetical protein
MDWVAPDAAAGPPPSPPSPAPVATPAPRSSPVARRLGPQTAPALLDGAFAIIKRAPATVIGLTALFVIPAEVLSAWMTNHVHSVNLVSLFESGDSSFVDPDQTGSTGNILWIYGALLPSALALVFVGAGIARLVGAWQVGADLTLGEVLRGIWPRTWSLLGAAVLVKLVEAVGMLGCTIAVLATIALCMVTVPAIVNEQLGPFDGVRRSFRLVQRRFWPVVGISVLVILLSMLVNFAFQALPDLFTFITGGDGVAWPILGAFSSMSALLTTPMAAGVAMLTYLDLRVRTEGLDLELDAIDLLPTTS